MKLSPPEIRAQFLQSTADVHSQLCIRSKSPRPTFAHDSRHHQTFKLLVIGRSVLGERLPCLPILAVVSRTKAVHAAFRKLSNRVFSNSALTGRSNSLHIVRLSSRLYCVRLRLGYCTLEMSVGWNVSTKRSCDK